MKTIKVRDETWYALQMLKIQGSRKSIDEMLDGWEELRRAKLNARR